MKTKLLLATLALPALFAACVDDDLTTSVVNKPNVNGELVELGEDFAIGLTRGDATDTRSNWHYEGNGTVLYSWLPTFDFNDDGSSAAINIENIGFAWRGETGDAKVRTNYKFTLDGFLKKGQTKPETIICNGQILVKNGYVFKKNASTGDVDFSVSSGKATVDLYGFDNATKTMSKSKYGLESTSTGKYTLTGAQATTLPDALDDTKLTDEDPYVRNGIFTTENSTVFKGEYIVYFPYNPEFAEINYLPASTPTIYTQDDALTNRVAHLAGKTFGYGKATIEKGGSMAESFTTVNLSSILDLKVKAESTKHISKIILVDEGENANGFVKTVGLDASKIGISTGTGLYVAGTEVYEPTIVLNLVSGQNAYAEVGTTAKEFTVAALPTTVKKLVAYLMDDNGLCLRKELATDKSLNPGKASLYEVEIKDTDKFDQALAVDTKTLMELIADYGNASTGKDATINVLGNITLDPEAVVNLGAGKNGALNTLFSFNSTKSIYVAKNIVVNGTGTITVPADLFLTFKVVDDKKLTFKNPIVLESAGCCGTNPATVVLMTKLDSKGTFVFDGAIQNFGKLYLANNTLTGGTYAENKNATSVIFNNTLLNGEDEYENAGEIYCWGQSNSVITMNGDVTNKGIIEIASKNKELQDGVEHQSTEIKAVQVTAKNVNNEGAINVDKYTYLSVNGTMSNAGSVIVATSSTGKNSEDGELYISTSGSVSNNGLVENYGVINNEGSLKNTSKDGEIVDHVGCQFGGNKAVALPGEYICDVEDTNVNKDGDRVGYAMGENMPTTTIRFIGNGKTDGEASQQYVYNLAGYKSGNVLPYNFIVAAESNVVLKGYTKDGAVSVTIDGTMNVNKGSKVELSQIKLTVNEDVTVNGAMTVNTTNANAQTTETVDAFVAKKDVNVNGGESNLASFEVAQYAKTNMDGNFTIANKYAFATFNYATYSDIANVLNINGKFTRVVSTGAQTANPAQVWCGSYTKGADAVIPNGLPQQR